MTDFNSKDEAAQKKAIAQQLVFIELKPDAAKRMEIPPNVPVLKTDFESDAGKGELPPAILAAGIEALKLLQPNMRQYDRFLARYYLLEGQKALQERPVDEYEAQRNFQKVLDLNLGELSAEAAFYIAGLVSAVDIPQAEWLYRRSIELNPAAASAHFELARLLRERRDLPGALEEFERAYRLEPTSLNLLNEIGDTHVMAEDFGRARASFARAYELDPEYWLFPVKLGLVEYELQQYSSAIKHLREGLDLSPDELDDGYSQTMYLTGLYNLGLAYRDSGDTARARKLFQAVLKLAPDHQGAIEALAVM